MASQFAPDASGSTKRPDLISILGILGFINTGLFLIIYGLGIPMMAGLQQMPLEEVRALVDESMSMSLPQEQLDEVYGIVDVMHASGVALILILFARTVVRLVGIIGLWKGRRWGFAVYALAQIVGIFLPHLVLPWSMMGFFGPFMALAMTGAYYSQYKRLT